MTAADSAKPETAAVPTAGAGPPDAKGATAESAVAKGPKEIGGRKGPEPTRYGDWERDGRCIDF